VAHRYYVEFNGVTSLIDCGSDASLDNLPVGRVITIDLWYRPRSEMVDGAYYLATKSDCEFGWQFNLAIDGGIPALDAQLATDGLSARSTENYGALTQLDTWQYAALVYSDTGDRKAHLTVGGQWATYLLQGAATGTMSSDTALRLLIGTSEAEGGFPACDIAWLRISDIARFTPGVNFTPPDRCIPPAVDANAVEIWKFPEGAGATTAASVVTPANDGAMTDCIWHIACEPVMPAKNTGPRASHGGHARHDYSLALGPSVVSTSGSASPMDITDLARDWSRSIVLQGGDWAGSFSMPLTKRAFNAFDSWMGCDIAERSGGGVSWGGMVYEMELSQGGVVWRRTFEDMANRIQAQYTNDNGDDQATAWAVIQSSIDRYGTREDILTPTTSLADVATNLTNKHLREHGWPHPVASSFGGEDGLSVSVCGYIFTLNWRHTTQDHELSGTWFLNGFGDPVPDELYWAGGDLSPYATALANAPARYSVWESYTTGEITWAYLGPLCIDGAHVPVTHGAVESIKLYTDAALTVPGYNVIATPPVWGPGWIRDHTWIRTNASRWIGDIIENDSEFLRGGIGLQDENRTQVDRAQFDIATTPARCWEAIQSVVSLGDPDNLPWRIHVGHDRKLHFTPVGTTPNYYYCDNNWYADPSGSPVNPWQLRPGIARALTGRWLAKRPDFWLPDPRDFLVEEFSVGADGVVSPKISNVSQTENLLNLMSAVQGFTVGEIKQGPGQEPAEANWDIENKRPNPHGVVFDEFGNPVDVYGYGYWTDTGYNADPEVTWNSYYDPDTGEVVHLP
jgi:hypothetical protein